MEIYDVVCLGTGEIGRPIYELFNGVYNTLPIDAIHYPENSNIESRCDYLHICIPGGLKNFDDIVVNYAERYEPEFVFVHSTVIPGTTRRLGQFLVPAVIHCPVHGKHHNNCMKRDMLRYPKYLGVQEGLTEKTNSFLKSHFEKVGFQDVRIFKNPETTEWLKLLSTTYFGLQIAWAQEVERICDEFNLNYNEVSDFFSIQEDVQGQHYSGVIGGHCVMPNIKIIKEVHGSIVCDFIEKSNELKIIREKGDDHES